MKFGPGGDQVRARTARRWLSKMGLVYSRYTKGVYFDGHERKDVVTDRNNIFLPQWKCHARRFVIFREAGTWTIPTNLKDNKTPLVFITHDESTFNANDGKRQGWITKDHQPLKPKSKGKGIMVSGFLTPGGRLCVPDNIPDSELLKDPMWVIVDGHPVCDTMWLFEYGKDNYWTGDMMVEHTINIALPIFRYAFPGCQALFSFDNASNHCSFSSNALVANKMNLNPGGKLPLMRDSFDYIRGLPQTMIFSENHQKFELRGKPKGLEVILQERKLSPENSYRKDGRRFLLQCPTTENRLGCDSEMEGGCCARTLMATPGLL